MNYIESLNVIQILFSSINSKTFSYAPTLLILFSKITCLTLVAIITLMTKLQFMGIPISCTLNENFRFMESFDTYCWYDGLYIKRDSSERLYSVNSGEHIFKIKYLSWVYWFLLLKIFAFYSPIIIWEYSERKFHNALKYEKYCLLYLGAVGKKIYFTSLKCQLLCLIIVISMCVGTNIFLSGYFTDLGVRWAREYLRADVMSNSEGGLAYIFPTIAKCKYDTFGISGSIEVRDYTCLLLINSFNEKIFVFLWFWYILLLIVVSLIFCYNLLLMLLPCFRAVLVSYHISLKYPLMTVFAKHSIGNYYILTTLLSNFSPEQLKSSIDAYYKKEDIVEFGWFDESNENANNNLNIDRLKNIFIANKCDESKLRNQMRSREVINVKNIAPDKNINVIQMDVDEHANDSDDSVLTTKM